MLTWNVFLMDFNKKELTTYNLFRHGGFIESLQKLEKEYKKKEKEISQIILASNDIETLKGKRKLAAYNKELDEWYCEEIRKWCSYYFWSKCEYEVVITSWPPYITLGEYHRIDRELTDYIKEYNKVPLKLNIRPDGGEKIDIYDQLQLNWNEFIRYIKEHRKEIKKWKRGY